MKIDLIIISAVMVLLVFLPFYLLPVLQMRGSKKISQLFKKEAAKLNLNVDIKESWNLNLIGIDSAAQKLLVFQNHDEVNIQHFDLKEVKQTELLVLYIPVEKMVELKTSFKGLILNFHFIPKKKRKF